MLCVEHENGVAIAVAHARAAAAWSRHAGDPARPEFDYEKHVRELAQCVGPGD